MRTYWFEIVGEDSDICGEEFFVEKENRQSAIEYANELFPGEEIECWGTVNEFQAEMMGLDTY